MAPAAINRLKRCVFIWRCIAITLPSTQGRNLHLQHGQRRFLSRRAGPAKCVIRPFTYVVMRMGDIPLVPYYRPRDDRIARDLAALAANRSLLLANARAGRVRGKFAGSR